MRHTAPATAGGRAGPASGGVGAYQNICDAELKAWIERLTRQLHGTFNRPTRCSAFSTINAMSDDEVDTALMEVVAIYDAVTRAELLERMRAAA